MPDLLIRGLDTQTMAALKAQAQKNGRTQQAEAKKIICTSIEKPKTSWSKHMRELSKIDGGVDFDLPPKTKSRCKDGVFGEACFY